MNRKIPATMASQHPDHARTPYWHDRAFINTRDETEECFHTFSDLGISEYKWDWEGKFVDEAVVERLFHEHFDYFKVHPLGKSKFLTFRLPNPKVETEFRLGRALMSILTASALAKQLGVHTPPVFEIILPMTESAGEMIDIQEAFQSLAGVSHRHFPFQHALGSLEVIPLFEQVSTMIRSDHIIVEYLERLRKQFKISPTSLRPYLARSDPALNSGIVPTILAIKIALSRYRRLERTHEIQLFPIIGSASLPFRGGLSPLTVQSFLATYGGVRTALLQSAFRYDYPKDDVVKAIAELHRLLPKTHTFELSDREERELRSIIPIFESAYRTTVEQFAPLVNDIAPHLPKRRERVQHIGLFGYSRSVGEVQLPRAIGFTGTMYSLGIPPEFIGTGRGLQALTTSQREILDRTYPTLRQNLQQAARFISIAAIERLSRQQPVWNEVLTDVRSLEELLGISICPLIDEEQHHYALVHEFMKKYEEGTVDENLLEEMATVRRSVG